jgi:hypothetical protein
LCAEKHLSSAALKIRNNTRERECTNKYALVYHAGLACKKISRSDCFLQGHKLIPAAIKIHHRHSKSTEIKTDGRRPAAEATPLMNKLGGDFWLMREKTILL